MDFKYCPECMRMHLAATTECANCGCDRLGMVLGREEYLELKEAFAYGEET